MSDRLCEYSHCVEQCRPNKIYCKQHSRRKTRIAHLERCFLCRKIATYRSNQYYFCDVHKTVNSTTILKYKCVFPGCKNQERQPSFVILNLCKIHRNEIYQK